VEDGSERIYQQHQLQHGQVVHEPDGHGQRIQQHFMISISFIYQRPRLPQIIARSAQSTRDRRWRITEARRVMACTSSQAGIGLFDEVNRISDTVY
jgi:hypothetical protein